MSSPHGSLFCSHWKCVAVVHEVNRIERFRCRWKEEGKKPRCWNHQSGCCRAAFSFFLVLPSYRRLSLVLISSIFLILSSYLISSLLCFAVVVVVFNFFFLNFVSLPVWTDMCSLTTGTTSPSGVSSAPLNLPTWAAWRATCIRHTQVNKKQHKQTQNIVTYSCISD